MKTRILFYISQDKERSRIKELTFFVDRDLAKIGECIDDSLVIL